MPRSRIRRKSPFTPPVISRQKELRIRNWVAPIMVGLFLIGLVWIVTYYIAGQSVPVMSDLGNWNLLIGFGFMAAGFGVSTQWR